MENQTAKQYTMEEGLVLMYNERGWVLLRGGEDPVGSDLHQESLKVPYKEHKSLLDYIKEIISKELEDTIN